MMGFVAGMSSSDVAGKEHSVVVIECGGGVTGLLG